VRFRFNAVPEAKPEASAAPVDPAPAGTSNWTPVSTSAGRRRGWREASPGRRERVPRRAVGEVLFPYGSCSMVEARRRGVEAC
jgi:hypothetical protein